MTKLENDVNQQGSKTELSRARQRKLKSRAKVGCIFTGYCRRKQADHSTPESFKTNWTIRKGTLRCDPYEHSYSFIPALQSKLSSKLGHITHPSTADRLSTKTLFSGAIFASRNSRRKVESQRGENHYQATASAETQRKTNADQQFIPRKNRRIYDAHSEAVPPVMVRGGMGGMAFGRAATSRLQKQRYPNDVSMCH